MHLDIAYEVDINKKSELSYSLAGYINSNYDGDLKDYKFLIGYCFLLIV